MAIVLLGTASVSATTMLAAAEPRLAAIPVAGSATYLAFTLWSVLMRPERSAGGVHGARTGLVALAAALALALADRHQVVASRGPAPDDIATALAVLVCAVVAARAPRRAGHPIVLGLALAAYALVCVSLVAGTSYHSDAVANVHRAAELTLRGIDPYRAIDTHESLDRFGLGRELATHLEDGTPLRSFNYPPLSFLVPVPAVALGLADVRVLYAGLVLVATLVAVMSSSAAWRAAVLATVIGNVVIARQYVLAGIDPVWAILLGAGLLALRRAAGASAGRWLAVSGILIGLAAASRQPAWFAIPFVVAAVRQDHGSTAALRYSALAATAFAIPALPFLVAAPVPFIGGVLAPILLPLEPHGVGLVRLGAEGVVPLLPRAVHAMLALAALLALLLVAHRRRPAVLGLPALAVAPLFLSWRALQNYFAFAGVFAALAAADDDARASGTEGSKSEALRLSPEREVTDAGRQGAARDPGLPGGQGAPP